MREREDWFDTRLSDINRLYELGFITWEELGEAHQAILLQDIADELDRMVKKCRHPKDFPLDK
jgi:hypothetical protein